MMCGPYLVHPRIRNRSTLDRYIYAKTNMGNKARESPGFGEAGLRAARKLRYEVQKPPAKGRKQASAANTCCHIEAS